MKELEEENQKKDDILEDWHAPPGSPWEQSDDTTCDTTSLSWGTEGINFNLILKSWDEGEETTEGTAEEAPKPEEITNETPDGDTESEDSLPELVSDDTEASADASDTCSSTRHQAPRRRTPTWRTKRGRRKSNVPRAGQETRKPTWKNSQSSTF